jgi:hypothetical protein
MQSARHDKRYATSGIAAHFSKSARSGAPPSCSLLPKLKSNALYFPVGDEGHPAASRPTSRKAREVGHPIYFTANIVKTDALY